MSLLTHLFALCSLLPPHHIARSKSSSITREMHLRKKDVLHLSTRLTVPPQPYPKNGYTVQIYLYPSATCTSKNPRSAHPKPLNPIIRLLLYTPSTTTIFNH